MSGIFVTAQPKRMMLTVETTLLLTCKLWHIWQIPAVTCFVDVLLLIQYYTIWEHKLWYMFSCLVCYVSRNHLIHFLHSWIWFYLLFLN